MAATSSFLVVGDGTESCESLAVMLRSRGHSVALAPSAADAIQSLRAAPASTVLVVCRGNDNAAQRLHSRILTEGRAARVILVNSVLTGGVDDRTVRWGIGNYRLSEDELLALAEAGVGSAETRNDEPAIPGVEALSKVLDVMVGLRELNDPHHRGSAHRSTVLARAVAEEMGVTADEVRGVELAALLRDIGHVEVEELIQEAGVFAAPQRARVQDHVSCSVRLLEHIEFPWPVLPLIRHHHEHYDGTGYPDGLKAREIPIGARILAVVDSYVAMLSDRPHRSRRSNSEAQAELVRLTGKHYDPEVVEKLLTVVRERTSALNSEKRPRLLIADPDCEFVKPIKIRLVNDGMEVDSVSSLEDAVLAVLDRPVSLLLASVDKDNARGLKLLQRIRKHPTLRLLPIVLLSDDDRVFKVRAFRLGVDDCLPRNTPIEEIAARLDNIVAREALRVADPDGLDEKGITGRLENLPLPDIFQILTLGMKTARVTLTADEGSGRVWLESGSAVHAAAGDLLGEKACYEMLSWIRGHFRIEHGYQTRERSIEIDTMFMVMEGMRLLDEAGANV